MSSEFTQVCDDLHKCRNGGQCVEHPDFPGMFTCDCATASSEVYAGFSCDHMATSYCNEDNTVDSKSFCTNNGVCRDFLDEDGFHQGCDCPDGYKGDYCEFTVNQSIPDHYGSSSPTKPASVQSPRSGGGGKNTALVASMAAIGALCGAALLVSLYVVMKRRKHAEIHEQMSPRSIRQADSAQLDHDGEKLRQSHDMESAEMYSSPMNSATSSSRRKLGSDVDMTEEVGEEISY